MQWGWQSRSAWGAVGNTFIIWGWNFIPFRSLFGYPVGPVNQFLYALGFYSETVRADGTVLREAFNFFRNVAVTRGIVAFIQWWMWYGHTLIMLMAGITSISTSLYESAVVDGVWRVFLFGEQSSLS